MSAPACRDAWFLIEQMFDVMCDPQRQHTSRCCPHPHPPARTVLSDLPSNVRSSATPATPEMFPTAEASAARTAPKEVSHGPLLPHTRRRLRRPRQGT